MLTFQNFCLGTFAALGISTRQNEVKNEVNKATKQDFFEFS